MLRQWIWIGMLVLMGAPIWAQQEDPRRFTEGATGPRVALVIGNADYMDGVSLRPLRNPVNDAQEMTKVLEEIGFEVISLHNAKKSQIGEAIHQFSEQIGSEGVALFYFSGHGLQVSGQNYLVPVDAKIQASYQVRHQCNSTNEVLDMMESRRGNRINVVILDACRNNPFVSERNKSVGRAGLTAMHTSGSIIAYATAPGKTALDGDGDHSPYTESLITRITEPDVEIVQMFRNVGSDVEESTRGSTPPQRPWINVGLNQSVYLVPSPNLVSLSHPLKNSLCEAARENRVPQIMTLLEQGIDPNQQDNAGQTPLHCAASTNAYQAASALLTKQANPNQQDNAGQTPLHRAALANAYQTASTLLQNRANLNQQDFEGRTPLHYAASQNAHQTASVLLQNRANPNQQDFEGQTPLHHAVSKNAQTVVKLLLENRANVNSTDHAGQTPLHHAASVNDIQLVRLLLQAGSQVNAADNTGLTPLDIARNLNSTQIIRILVERVAKIYWASADWTNASRGKIQHANLDGSQVEDLVTVGNPDGLALDLPAGKIYWVERSSLKIQRANLDGSQVEDLATTGLDAPIEVALDVSAGKMYWMDHNTGKVQRANLDGSQVEDLVTGVRYIHGLALDVSAGKMYLGGMEGGKIIRANLDGSQIEDLVTGLSGLHGLALDVSGGKMYWVSHSTGKVQRANLDGSQVEDLVTGLSNLRGIALDVSIGKMYWTNEGSGKIQRANLDGSRVEDVITELSAPRGIALDLAGSNDSSRGDNRGN